MDEIVREALRQMPRWHVIHWGTPGTSTLLCLWVAGREAIVPVDGAWVTYEGVRRAADDGGLVRVLREVQVARDRAALATPAATTTRDWLVDRWGASGSGSWPFSRGFVRWARNGQLHVEAGESGLLLPDALRDVLVDIGWNPPNATFHNCWLQAEPDEHTAALCVLTPLAAFGYDSPPPVPA